MSLDYDFLLLDRSYDLDDDRSRHDFLRYHRESVTLSGTIVAGLLGESLGWVPRYDLTRGGLAQRRPPAAGGGLADVGEIRVDGAAKFAAILDAWAGLLSHGPEIFVVRGARPFCGRCGVGYARESVVERLRTLAGYARRVAESDGAVYLLYLGE